MWWFIMIEFQFEELLTENLGKILKPFALVTLINGDKYRESKMLIDSGADITLIPKSAGERLELTPSKQDEIKYLGGIAGGVPVVYRTIDLKIEDIKFSCRIAWAQIEDVPTVLGRVDVFDKFDIEFKQQDRKVLFKEK